MNRNLLAIQRRVRQLEQQRRDATPTPEDWLIDWDAITPEDRAIIDAATVVCAQHPELHDDPWAWERLDPAIREQLEDAAHRLLTYRIDKPSLHRYIPMRDVNPP